MQLKDRVLAGDLAGVSEILANGGAVDARDDDGWTAAFHAAVQDHDAILDRLIAAGADVERPEEDPPRIVVTKPRDEWKGRTTLLHVAAAFGSPRCVRLLLARGMKVDQLDAAGSTPLMYAAKGVTTWFHPALKPEGREGLDVVRELLAAGADPNATNDDRHTALDVVWARAPGALDVINLLLEAGADPNGGGGIAGDPTARPLIVDLLTPPRSREEQQNGLAVLEELLNNRMDPYLVTGILARAVTCTPASKKKGPPELDLLLSKGPQPHPSEVALALEAAATLEHEAQPAVIATLLRCGTRQAVLDACLAVVVDRALNPYSGKSFGSLKPQSLASVERLLAAGARPDAPISVASIAGGSFATALHRAATLSESNEHDDPQGKRRGVVLEALLAKATTADLPDAAGDTPLHLACRHGLRVHAEKLLARGADPRRTNGAGESAYDLARQHRATWKTSEPDALSTLERLAG